ncbi:MAG: hypothetical protein V7782_06445, partial [Psychromonas sp.]
MLNFVRNTLVFCFLITLTSQTLAKNEEAVNETLQNTVLENQLLPAHLVKWVETHPVVRYS